jgi:hypothetical protein
MHNYYIRWEYYRSRYRDYVMWIYNIVVIDRINNYWMNIKMNNWV